MTANRDIASAFRHGALYLGGGQTRFRVWAPDAGQVELQITSPIVGTTGLERREDGYWEAALADAPPGTKYLYSVDGGAARPDPASRLQSNGVRGPSQVTSPEFGWSDEDWRGLRLEQCVLYELHVGTFTPEGTFDAVVPHLAYLRELGVTMIELMPVAQFPGERNWGYDGVYPFAVQSSFGGPAGLRRLVDACHRLGLGVALDVVYNHLGPEGNYLATFGPYFTHRHTTPWGSAINFDGPGSDEVRRFFIENALYWIRDFHIDGLRLDAVHSIFDQTAYPFLEELGDAVHAESARLKRQVLVMPESNASDPRLIRSKSLGGWGLDAQWADDFHHALRVLLTGDRSGYYADFGQLNQLAKSFEEGFAFTGDYSRFRRRRHGAPTSDIPALRFIVFSQNHDHVGNRMLGERLGHLVTYEDLKLAAAAVLLSPHVPMLFMGEEYAELAPFQYFVSHSDGDLVEAVRRGRQQEFSACGFQENAPDPQAEETFMRCKLNHALRSQGQHAVLLEFYRELLRLRREVRVLAALSRHDMEVTTDKENVLLVRRWFEGDETILVLSFSDRAATLRLPEPASSWKKLLDSADKIWGGPGGAVSAETAHPRSAVLYQRREACGQ